MIKKALYSSISILIFFNSLSQEIPLYSHYFMNPYLYNSAYVGIEGRPAVFLTHRRQWVGIEDAPVTSNFTFHTPLTRGLSFGLNINQDERSILTTSNLLATFGFVIPLGTNHFIRFALSGGMGLNTVDNSVLGGNDPALQLFNDSKFLDGNFGFVYQIGNLNLGFALPRIFKNEQFGLESIDIGEVTPTDEILLNLAYRHYFANDQFAFEPRLYYRLSEDNMDQYEASGILHIKNAMWLGGSYREDFGFTGLIGFKIKNSMGIGYSFGTGISEFSGIDNATHEIQLSIAFGDKTRKNVPQVYSFIDIGRERELVADEEPEEEPEEEPIVEPEPEEEPEEEPEKEPEPIEEDPIVVIEPEIEPEVEPEEDKPVVVKRGGHLLEYPIGHYVIVGAFSTVENAEAYSDRLFEQGYQASFGYLTARKYYYVHVFSTDTSEKARAERDRLRRTQFKDAWYLLVEN